MKVDEESTMTFTLNPLDENGVAFTPGTARYRIDDLLTSTELVAWTALTVGTTMTIQVPATVNAIIDSGLETEQKVFTVQTDENTASQTSSEKVYDVVNLHFAQVP